MSKPTKMNMTLSGHLRVDVIRKVFGIKADGLKAGVWSYGTKSKGKSFVLTADVIDEFSDVKRWLPFLIVHLQLDLNLSRKRCR